MVRIFPSPNISSASLAMGNFTFLTLTSTLPPPTQTTIFILPASTQTTTHQTYPNFPNQITHQGWQYVTFRIWVQRTSHRTSVPYFSSIFEAYRTNVPFPYHYKKRRTVLLAKIEAYRTVLTYCTVLPFLLLTTRNFN